MQTFYTQEALPESNVIYMKKLDAFARLKVYFQSAFGKLCSSIAYAKDDFRPRCISYREGQPKPLKNHFMKQNKGIFI